MKALTRYITTELLKVFCLVLSALTLLVMLAVIVQEAVRQGLGVMAILRLLPFVLPDSLRFAVPGAILLVATTVYGRMSSSNEIVAIKSLGIPPLKVLAPVLWLGAALSLASVWLNDVAVSWGRAGVQKVVVESVEEIAYRMLRTQRSYSSGKMAMNVRSVEGHMLMKPTLTLQQKGDRPSITITAERAELSSDTEEGTLTIRFHDAVMEGGDGKRIAWPGMYEHVVRLKDFSRRGREAITPSNLPLREIPASMAQTTQRIGRLRQQNATLAAFQLVTGEFDRLDQPEWHRRIDSQAETQRRLDRLRTEPHRRWANGLSCLCFVLVGSAMSVRRRKGDFLTSFFLCFLPILLIYYPLLIFGVDRAKAGALPPQAVWLANVVLLVWGLWLVRKVSRY